MMSLYVTFSQVRRKLDSLRGEKVTFSDSPPHSISIVRKKPNGQIPGNINNNSPTRANTDNNSDLLFSFLNVLSDPDFVGMAEFTFEFTSPTTFKCTMQNAFNKQELFLGLGDISTDFSTPHGFVFQSSVWGGTIVEGDTVTVSYKSMMSISSAEEMVVETEIEIDNYLQSTSVFDPPPFGFRMFELNTPEAITVATTYLAAYYIFTDVFMSNNKNDCDEKCTDMAKAWKKRAEKILADFVKLNGRASGGPAICDFPSQITHIGIPGVLSGAQTKTKDLAKLNAAGRDNEIFTTRARYNDPFNVDR